MKPLADLRPDRLLLALTAVGAAMWLLGRLYSVRGAEWFAALGLLGWFVVRMLGRRHHYLEETPVAFRVLLLLAIAGMILSLWLGIDAFAEDMARRS